MENHPPTNADVARTFRPWYPPITKVMEISHRDVLYGTLIHGTYTPTERANVFHAAARHNFEAMCDAAPKLFEVVQDDGLDYVVLRTDSAIVAFRWPKYDGLRVNRNDTDRQKAIQLSGTIEEQGALFGDMDKGVKIKSEGCQRIPVVACAYTIEDDYTESGIPCWWMGKIALLRERIDSIEFIENMKTYGKPIARDTVLDQRSPRMVAREQEIDELQKMTDEVRRKTG